MAPKKPQKENRVLTTLAGLGAAVVVASLAFFSLELALVAAGFFVTVGYVTNDLRRRKFWENGISFRMKGLSDNISSLSQKVTGTRQDILNLRQEIADVNRRLNKQADHADGVQSKTTARAAPAASKPPLIDEALLGALRRPAPAAPVTPRAVRPGQKPAAPEPQPGIANDAEYEDLSDMVVRELVGHAVRSRAVDVFVQPIVRLPQRRVRFYEVFARVRARPGMYLPARRYMRLAQENKLSNEIDNLLLAECLKTIQSSAHIERAAPLFMNVSQSTLRNTLFLKTLLGFLAKNRHLAPRLVMEIATPQFKTLDTASREILRGLGKLGCSVSLDHVDVLDFEIADLQKFYIRFIKIEARTLLPYTRSDKGRAELMRRKRALEGNGISLIVEKVENENDLLELLDFDISYGQGHLFGRPDLEAAYRKRRAA
ncbi:MAG TPA: EAL domain-containing protein [Alphaproteobacteria bacterium]|nr:EAL domain-containing protein [Micavibrio sp.]MBK9561667.1 EAL domain-containing protein [Micavibrio sp.]HQX27157.1 EAL domain-containing protein [Alphaproteobacteria bacterium]